MAPFRLQWQSWVVARDQHNPPSWNIYSLVLYRKCLLIPGLNKLKQKSLKHSLSVFHIHKASSISCRQTQWVVFFFPLSGFDCRIPFSWGFPRWSLCFLNHIVKQEMMHGVKYKNKFAFDGLFLLQEFKPDLIHVIKGKVLGCPYRPHKDPQFPWPAADQGSQPQTQHWTVCISRRNIWGSVTVEVCGTKWAGFSYSLMSGIICKALHSLMLHPNPFETHNEHRADGLQRGHFLHPQGAYLFTYFRLSQCRVWTQIQD